jgi:hypothetical protein
MGSTKTDQSSFNASVRIFSFISVCIAVGVFFVRTFTAVRGIEFGTHVLLIVASFAQLALLLIFLSVAIHLQFKGRLRCSRFSKSLAVIAAIGIAGQFYAVHTMTVISSSIP